MLHWDTGIAEFLFYYIKDKIIDRFILLDTLLLIVLGAISIVFENDLFFKIKPALIEAILLAVIAFSLWGPRNILMAMSERYMGEMHLDPSQEKSMRNNMLAVFWITVITYYSRSVFSLLHVKRGLVFYQRRTLLYIFRTVFCLYAFEKQVHEQDGTKMRNGSRL